MAEWIEQSTAVTKKLGPFLDETDGKTAETALTIAQADIRLSKNGGAFAQTNNVTGATHDENGYYGVPLDTTDTATLGSLRVAISESGALPVWQDFMVVPSNVWDSLFGADKLQVHTAEITAALIDSTVLADNAVTAAKIATDAITAAKIATDAITAAKIAADAIGASELATDAVDEISDGVWDEVLTGAAHNVVNSAGRRLRFLQEAGTYAGAIWIDTVNGVAGTTDFENGTDSNPVSTIADANTLAASLGISTFHIASGSTITLAASQQNQVFCGSNWILALGGQNIDGSRFVGATVTGIATNTSGTQIFDTCRMGAVTIPEGTHYRNCSLEGTQTIGEAGDFFFDQCHSAIAGTSTPSLDFGVALNSSNVSVRHYSGGIEIQNMGTGTGSYTMSLEGYGQLIINANCSATSTVAVRGNFTVTDNAGGAVTLSDDARIDVDQIGDAAWDEAISGHQVQGSSGALLTMTGYSGPNGPGVYLDDGAANTSTTIGDDGTTENPVSTIAAATTIATSMGLQRIYLINDTVITLAQTYEGWDFVGLGGNNQINLGSQDVDNTFFYNVILTGTQGGTGSLGALDCGLNALLALQCIADRCYFMGNSTLRASTLTLFDQCKSSVAGDGTPELTFPGSGTTNLSIRHYSGGMQLNSGTATDTVSFESDGQIVIDATCTSLNVTVRGNCTITDNGTTTSLTEDAAVTRTSINAECDTAISDAALATAAALATVDAIVDAILVDTAEIGTAGAGLSDLGGMSTGMKAEIEAEVNDALDTAISELAVGIPTATPTLRTAAMLAYMVLRNKLVTQTSGVDALEVYNDAGVMIAKKLLTDAAGDYTEAEMVSG